MRDTIRPAELHQRRIAIPAIGRFQTPRLVIDAGVNLSAIAPGLMTPPSTLFLQEQDLGSRMPLCNGPSDGETNDAPTNYCDVV